MERFFESKGKEFAGRVRNGEIPEWMVWVPSAIISWFDPSLRRDHVDTVTKFAAKNGHISIGMRISLWMLPKDARNQVEQALEDFRNQGGQNG